VKRIALFAFSLGLTFSAQRSSAQIDSAKIDRKDYKVQRQHDDFERSVSWSLQGFDVVGPSEQICFFSLSLNATRSDADSAGEPRLLFVTGVAGESGSWSEPPDSLLFLAGSQRIAIARVDARPITNGWFTVFGPGLLQTRQLARTVARGRIGSGADKCDFSWSERDAFLLRLFLRRELRDSI
jgi:hypothetical protein